MDITKLIALSLAASMPLAMAACNTKSATSAVAGRYVGLEEGEEARELELKSDGTFVEEYCGMHHWVWGGREGSWHRDKDLITLVTPFELLAPAMTVAAAESDDFEGVRIRFLNWEGQALEGVLVRINNYAQRATDIDGVVEYAFDEYEGRLVERDLRTLHYEFDGGSVTEAVDSPGVRSFEVTIESLTRRTTVDEHEWWFVRGDRLVLAAAIGNQFESRIVSKTNRNTPLCSGAEFGRPKPGDTH